MHRSPRNLVACCLATAASLLAVLLVLLLPNAAHAFADDKTVPAVSCRAMQVSVPAGTLGVRIDGTIENDSAVNDLWVMCPIVRDTTQSVAAWAIEVRVEDKTNAGKIECTTTSRSFFGGFADDGVDDTGPNNVFMGLDTLNMTVTPQSADGYSVLKCKIPKSQGGNRSKIFAYTTHEPDDADTTKDRKTYTGTFAEIATAAAGTPPFINYPDFGKASPRSGAANDEWILPVIRDTVDGPVVSARLRLNDTDADSLVECWLAGINEDGSNVPNLGYGPQDNALGNATATCDDIDQGDGNGPYAFYCDSMASDISVFMYDFEEDKD